MRQHAEPHRLHCQPHLSLDNLGGILSCARSPGEILHFVSRATAEGKKVAGYPGVYLLQQARASWVDIFIKAAQQTEKLFRWATIIAATTNHIGSGDSAGNPGTIEAFSSVAEHGTIQENLIRSVATLLHTNILINLYQPYHTSQILLLRRYTMHTSCPENCMSDLS